ncbi:hypothetical protein [Terricaulis sp.]|uniref:hypothetical protein n=1 Tax=Terricaulis sp. TaxID=2768686 RepID=UPI0037845173
MARFGWLCARSSGPKIGCFEGKGACRKTRPCAFCRGNRFKSAFLRCDSRGEMRGIRRDIAKTGVFSGFSAIFSKGAVTLHQELNGITQHAGGENKAQSQAFTGGSLSLTQDNL